MESITLITPVRGVVSVMAMLRQRRAAGNATGYEHAANHSAETAAVSI
jgi:hypothetical protein